MPAIILTNLTFSYTADPLLEDVTATVAEGERVCVIGPNGSGKSTLLRLVSGLLAPQGGDIAAPEVYVPESINCFPAGTVGALLSSATGRARDLGRRLEEVAQALATRPEDDLTEEYDRILAQMNALGVWGLDSLTAQTVTGLGLPELETDRELATLSPGQLARLTLASTLLARPEALVLDEPTNHLDAQAIGFLADVMRNWSGPVLFTSHDRAFIDEVATALLDLDTEPWRALRRTGGAGGAGAIGGAYRCSGNYSAYLRDKADARAYHARAHAEQRSLKADLVAHRRASEHVGHRGAPARTEGRMAKKFYADRAQRVSTRRRSNDKRRLEALTAIEVRKPRSYALTMSLPPVTETGALAISMRAAAIAGRLARVTIDVAEGEHLLVTGDNGAGKSTLLRWLATGAPDAPGSSGSAVTMIRPHLIPQRLPHPGDPGIDDAIWSRGVGERGKGVLHPSYWNQPLPELSDGNQRRVQLALAVGMAPSLLLIDEPTNYLDLDALEALETALARWNGTAVVASHDRWLIDHWEGSRLHLERPRAGRVEMVDSETRRHGEQADLLEQDSDDGVTA